MAVGYYSFENWEEVHRSHARNKLHVVLQSLDNPRRIAHFKFGFELGVDPEFHGPLSGNERIAYELAEMLDLPVMPVQFYRHLGLKGHIRWAVPYTSSNWSFLEVGMRRNIPRYFNDPEVLVRMFVFDVWTCNHDRHEGNVLYTVSPSRSKHDIFLIDHDLALYGTERKWHRFDYRHHLWFQAEPFLRLIEVGRLVKSYETLRPTVEAVTGIPDEVVDAIVDGVHEVEDGTYLSSREAWVIKKMLRLRKDRLESMFREWCDENGKA
jgi:hypothetical protein